MKLNQNSGSGMIVEIKGTKPKELIQPRYISLSLSGTMFWRSMEQQFGNLPIKIVRLVRTLNLIL